MRYRLVIIVLVSLIAIGTRSLHSQENDSLNVRIAGTIEVTGDIVDFLNDTLITLTRIDTQYVVRFYDVSDYTDPQQFGQVIRSTVQTEEEHWSLSSIALISGGRFLIDFAIFVRTEQDHWTIDHTWLIEGYSHTNSRFLQIWNGVSYPSYEHPDFSTPITFAYGDYVYVYSGYTTVFGSLVVNLNSNQSRSIRLPANPLCFDAQDGVMSIGYLHPAYDEHGFELFNITNGEEPSTICRLTDISAIREIKLVDNLLIESSYYYEDRSVGIWDISDLEEPEELIRFGSEERLSLKCVMNNLLFCSRGSESSGIDIYDISEPTEPELAGFYHGIQIRKLYQHSSGRFIATADEDNYILELIGDLNIEEEQDAMIPRLLSFNVYPNPFNSSTTVEFTLPNSNEFTIRVFNNTGRIVSEVSRHEISQLQSGSYKWIWNPNGLPSGNYFIQLNAGLELMYQPVILLK